MPGLRLVLQVITIGGDALPTGTTLGNGRGSLDHAAATDDLVVRHKLLLVHHLLSTLATHKALLVKHQIPSFGVYLLGPQNDGPLTVGTLLGSVLIVAVLARHAPPRQSTFSLEEVRHIYHRRSAPCASFSPLLASMSRQISATEKYY